MFRRSYTTGHVIIPKLITILSSIMKLMMCHSNSITVARKPGETCKQGCSLWTRNTGVNPYSSVISGLGSFTRASNPSICGTYGLMSHPKGKAIRKSMLTKDTSATTGTRTHPLLSKNTRALVWCSCLSACHTRRVSAPMPPNRSATPPAVTRTRLATKSCQ